MPRVLEEMLQSHDGKYTTVELTFRLEMAHRLFGGEQAEEMPILCRSIHGHSWTLTVEILGWVGSKGMLIEFGKAKDALRQVFNDYDHSIVLHEEDPLVEVLRAFPEMRVRTLPQEPTTEVLSAQFAMLALNVFDTLIDGRSIWLQSVRLQETPVNTATWHK